MRHLLMACSDRKFSPEGEFEAFKLYDGVAYRVVRNYVAAGGEQPKIWIVSAKYGLIREDTPIQAYNLKMDKHIARRQLRDNTQRLQELVAEQPTEMFVFLGVVYNSSLPNLQDHLPSTKITRAVGSGIGYMLGELKDWLYLVPPGK